MAALPVFVCFVVVSATCASPVLREVAGFNVTTPPSLSPCPAGFQYKGTSCYAGIRIYASWPESLEYCEQFGAELAIISSVEEQQAIQGYLQTLQQGYGDHDDHQFWIGAIDYVSEGDWIWAVTTQTLTYSNWAPGNPDNGGSNGDDDDEHCAEMSEKRNWMWNDNGCHERKHFLCEIVPE